MSQVSVIVPVYNAEKTLEKCLNSIKLQTFTDFEVILINDGSKDNSVEICKKFCSDDSRFKLINQENCGLSAARNTGIDNAVSTYLSFVDSDDYIETDMIEKLYKAAVDSHADMSICGFYTDYSDGRRTKHSSRFAPGLYTGEKCKELAIDSIDYYFGGIRPYSCIRMIKRECMNKYNLRFNPNIRCSEDFLIWTICFFKVNSVCLITDKPLYHYIQNNDSVTHSYIDNYWSMVLSLYKELNDSLPDEKLIKEKLKYVLIWKSYSALHICAHAPNKKIFKNQFKIVVKDKLLIRTIKSLPFSIGFKKYNIYYILMRLHLHFGVYLVYLRKFKNFRK